MYKNKFRKSRYVIYEIFKNRTKKELNRKHYSILPIRFDFNLFLHRRLYLELGL